MPFWRRKPEPGRPPMPPEELLSGLGPGDYFETGQRILTRLDELAGVKSSDRVLDVGCGLGRLAWPLSGRLGGRGSYDGLDTVPGYVAWCAANLGLDAARFRFHHADLRNSFYNPTGAIAAEEFVFPFPDRSFDLVVATSLFTHLLPPVARRYLAEIARMLDRGGRLFASFFLLDEEGHAAVATGFTTPRFAASIEHGLVDDPAVPEAAVAHDAAWLFETLDAAGLECASLHPGYWKGHPGLECQDFLVATRRGEPLSPVSTPESRRRPPR